MTSAHSLFLLHTPLVSFPRSPHLPLFSPPRNSRSTLACSSSRRSAPATEQEVLRAISESAETSLPCVRTYENELARIGVVGAVDFQQALTAAAADGGEAADEHISEGVTAMVVETLLPGHSDPYSTISTRLFLPAGKVKEKAGELRSSITQDMLSTTTSRNILAMTFRQVVLELLWNFQLVVFRPGSQRDMMDLENPREVTACVTLSSSDERILFVLAEVVCISALQNTEKQFLEDYMGNSSSNLHQWFRKPRQTVSKDGSVVMYKLFEDEIVENAKSLLEHFKSTKSTLKSVNIKSKWWTPSALSKLEKIGGPEFSCWASEYVPAYRLQVDANQHTEVKFEGWKKCEEKMWEVRLTHSQMVGLADIIDMYYEDSYTLPDKELSCGVVPTTNISNKKVGSFILKFLSVSLASGILFVAISALGQFGSPNLRKGANYLRERKSFPITEVHSAVNQCSDTVKLEAFCESVVKKIKDSLGWSGEITLERNVGAWTGKVPDYLRTTIKDQLNKEDLSTISIPLDQVDEELKASAQDIASYQVVLSADGTLVGFQPLSRAAVNHWAANPLSKELYQGKKLSPGLMEPGLKVKCPDEIAVIELLMSVKPDESFAFARPIR